jgi:heavy metal efflux system protein
VKYGGQFENLEQAKSRLSIAVPVALLLILVMLYFAFGSFKYGLLIFSAIPLSAMGGIFALALRGMPFSISAGIGFIALFGVAVLNGIVLIAEFNRLKNTGLNSLQEIVLQGACARLRPVLMTASVASLGFLPMALSNGAGAEVQRPLATVVIGGLLIATLLTLFVLPILYVWIEKTKTMKMKTQTICLILCCSFAANGWTQNTQTKLTVEQMIALGKQKNRELQLTQKQAAYWKQLQVNVYELPKTHVLADFGNVNSFKTDTRFSVAQSFVLPIVYKRQGDLYKANEQSVNQLLMLKEQELNRAIKLNFYCMVDLLERDKLLSSLDSMYKKFMDAADRRLKAGETNQLEKTTAEVQWQQIVLQRNELAEDLKMEQQRMQFLLNTNDWLLPVYSKAKINDGYLIDTNQMQNHAAVQLAQKQTAIAFAETALEKNKLSPEFEIGYANQSFVGWQTDDGVNNQFFSSGNRFHSVQASVAFPIFNKTTKNKIKAAKLNEERTQMQVQQTQQQLKSEYLQWTEMYQKAKLSLQYFETSGEKQANIIAINAQQSFEKGAIDYLQWGMLMNQVVGIRLGHLEAIKNFNHAIVQMQYFTSN